MWIGRFISNGNAKRYGAGLHAIALRKRIDTRRAGAYDMALTFPTQNRPQT
ncbi:hypothetical protein V1281_005754 [Nitrobacteraceae bacterium AZCC 2161]